VLLFQRCHLPVVVKFFKTPFGAFDLQRLAIFWIFSRHVSFCQTMNKFNRGNYYIKQKAELTKGILLRRLGHLCFLRPVAFRPPLTKGLALSRTTYIQAQILWLVNFFEWVF